MDDSIDLNDIGAPAVEALLGRFSAWPLMEPAPSACELGSLFDLAVRAPDHGGLKPWTFVTIQAMLATPCRGAGGGCAGART